MKSARPKRTRLRASSKAKVPSLSDTMRARVEAATGYRFQDTGLLDAALTHPSALTAEQARKSAYQRLEFLGDRVLGLVIAERLYTRRPGEREGALAPRLNRLVRKESCAAVMRRLDLGPCIILGISEQRADGANKDGILGDACEALIAAIYLDGGLKPARAFIEKGWADLFRGATAAPPKEAKTLLQEWALSHGDALPEYETVGRRGPDHDPVFTIVVRVDGLGQAEGEGGSKQEAERAAALKFLKKTGHDVDEH